MKRLFLLYLLIALCMIVIGCASSSTYSPSKSTTKTPIFDKLIVQGERIGPISIDMIQADVLKILGTPPSISHNDDERVFGYYYKDLTVVIDEDSRVRNIATNSSEYETDKGVRVGMTEPEVRAKMGKPTRSFLVNEFNLTYFYYGESLEIVFNPKNGYSISMIGISR